MQITKDNIKKYILNMGGIVSEVDHMYPVSLVTTKRNSSGILPDSDISKFLGFIVERYPVEMGIYYSFEQFEKEFKLYFNEHPKAIFCVGEPINGKYIRMNCLSWAISGTAEITKDEATNIVSKMKDLDNYDRFTQVAINDIKLYYGL